MHEIYLVKVPETLGLITQTAPITIMTRSPVADHKASLFKSLRINSLLLLFHFYYIKQEKY